MPIPIDSDEEDKGIPAWTQRLPLPSGTQAVRAEINEVMVRTPDGSLHYLGALGLPPKGRHYKVENPDFRGQHRPASSKPREVAKTAISRGKAAMETSNKTEKSKTKELYPEELNSWQKLVKRIQDRKRWSQLGHTLKYSKNGVPKKEGPATGFGKHIGRWSWREIAFCW